MDCCFNVLKKSFLSNGFVLNKLSFIFVEFNKLYGNIPLTLSFDFPKVLDASSNEHLETYNKPSLKLTE